jgi:zinc D-Ala-D-Ala carboxypeptidase
MKVTDWSKYHPYFSKEEFDCKHTGKNEMRVEFMDRLLAVRLEYGQGMIVTSGYRDPSHPEEAEKLTPGAHPEGRAGDFHVDRGNAYRLLFLALHHGFTGIGIKQSGNGRFLHLDDIPKNTTGFLRPTVWSY